MQVDSSNTPAAAMRFRHALVGLVLFGISFGYVEAAIVIYLRMIYDPIAQRVNPDREPGELFPLVRVDQLEAQGPEHIHRLYTELGREAATLLMLAAVAAGVARNFRQWFAAFIVAFGIWDIFFYVFLELLVDWPASLWTWDILFLLPVPWVGPVLAPVLVACAMIVAGTIILWRESVARPIRFRWYHWALLAAGGLIVVLAFCWDYRHTTAGGFPHPFHWPLFWAGYAVGGVSFLAALSQS